MAPLNWDMSAPMVWSALIARAFEWVWSGSGVCRIPVRRESCDCDSPGSGGTTHGYGRARAAVARKEGGAAGDLRNTACDLSRGCTFE